MTSRDATWMTQVRRGMVDFFILSTLAHTESYGYQVLQDMERLHSISLTESTLYPSLARLKREGYLSMRKLKSDAGPTRNYYSLTRTGRAHLEDMFDFWQLFDREVRSMYAHSHTEGTP